MFLFSKRCEDLNMAAPTQEDNPNLHDRDPVEQQVMSPRAQRAVQESSVDGGRQEVFPVTAPGVMNMDGNHTGQSLPCLDPGFPSAWHDGGSRHG